MRGFTDHEHLDGVGGDCVGAYETVKVTEQSISDYQSGALTGSQVSKNAGFAVGEALVVKKAKLIWDLPPQAITDKASAWGQALEDKAAKTVDSLKAKLAVTGEVKAPSEPGDVAKRTVSKIDDITKPGSKLPNIKTDVPKSESEKNLLDKWVY